MDEAATRRAEAWLQSRLSTSLLVEHYLRLKAAGLDAVLGGDAVFALAAVYGLNRCAFLATVGAQIVGRERLVRFIGPTGHLIHAVIAVSPQEPGEPLRGDAVDILGRENLPTALATFRCAFGAVTVEIGDLVPGSEFEPGEHEALVKLCGALPWIRKTLLLPEPDVAPGQLLLDGASWALSQAESVTQQR